MTSRRVVGILGLGYVGLPLALAAAESGHRVVGYDVDEPHVRRLTTGRSPVEDVSDAELEKGLGSGDLRLTADPEVLGGCDSYIICVPTPLVDRAPDLSMVISAADVVAANLALGDLVVLESTTYPGTTEEVIAPRISAATGLRADADYHLAFSPERIDPGNRSYGIRNTPKIVGGVGQAAARAAHDLYRSFVDEVHVVSSPREAEMAKLLENTFRHVNIALVNEMAVFCQELGVNLWEAIDAAATKPFGFIPFKPGPGVGGHCIPIDPSYLSWHVRRLGYSFRFVELACEINDRMPDYIAFRAAELLNRRRKAINGSRILILGVAYKRDVSDTRESPAGGLARRLASRGGTVVWHDPLVERFQLDSVPFRRIEDLSERLFQRIDLVIIHTDHSTYDWAWIVENSPLVLDTRNATAGLADPRIERL